ncbi:MAG TPA: DMT family transporter [Eubacteriales bacterium]|nr:DMT family transporter [Clostridia bacterium]HRV72597.1 DMT family transporter [Eubacteriales bacterium]
MWFLYALAATVAWGAADLFYKRGADPKERYTHLKTAIVVGFVMGLHAIGTLIVTKVDYNLINLLYYLPVSLMYILSMVVGYLGLRYLELSIASPVQNASGALCCILCLLILGQTMDALSAIAVALVCVGVFLLGMFERMDVKVDGGGIKGFKAFLIPIAYCVIDALGTFLDAFYLDDAAASPLVGVTEDNIETVANVSYELTFLIAAVLLSIFVYVIKRERVVTVFKRDRIIAACLETGGQFAYVYAMSGMAVIAAPMVSSYSIVSVLLSAVFLKERLSKKQYIAVAVVLIGIALLGVAEALAP